MRARVAMVLSTVITVSTVSALSHGSGRGRVSATADRPTGRSHPLAVVHAWDRRRAAAWAHADPEALATIYAPRSRTGRRDVAELDAYAARGLRVVGMLHQVLRLQVVHESGNRLVVRVRGRVVDAVAVGRSGSVALPTARPTTYRIVLVRARDGWKMAEAYGRPPSPAAITSVTSRSRNS